MREIKFRAYDGKNIRFDMGVGEVLNDGLSKWVKLPLMQFTGLQDKNGIDIYEGDVVNITYWNKPHLQEVKYDADIGFVPMQEPCDYDEVYLSKSHIEVVGNIYENPELLNETKAS